MVLAGLVVGVLPGLCCWLGLITYCVGCLWWFSFALLRLYSIGLVWMFVVSCGAGFFSG